MAAFRGAGLQACAGPPAALKGCATADSGTCVRPPHRRRGRTTMTKGLAILFAAAAVTVGVSAQQDKKTDSNVAGVWQMNVQGDHVIQIGMELKQDGTKVTGTILMPTQHVGQRRDVSL